MGPERPEVKEMHSRASDPAPALTLEKPDTAQRVLEGGIDRAGDALPVAGGQRWVAVLQLAGPQPPHVAGLEEEELPADGGRRLERCAAGVGLPRGIRSEPRTAAAPLPAAAQDGSSPALAPSGWAHAAQRALPAPPGLGGSASRGARS